MRIIKENKLQESLGIEGFSTKGNTTFITINEMDIGYSIKKINQSLKPLGGKCRKTSDNEISIENKYLIDFAINNLG